MKKTRLNRKSKSEIRKIQDKLWSLCRELTFKKYGNVCWTCDAKNLEGRNRQCGHMWAKASLGAYLKYDLRILRPQCNVCNGYYGGMGADFYAKVLKEIGQGGMRKLEMDRNVLVRAKEHYLMLIDKYEKLLNENNSR